METRHAAAPRRHGEQRPRESLDGIRQRLSDAVGSECYERYFEHQARLEMEDGRLCVTVPSPFVRDLITRRFGASIREAAGTGDMRVVGALPVAVTDDTDAAKERAARVFAVYGHLPSYRAMMDREGAEGPADVALIGDEATVRAGIERMASAGVTDFVAVPFFTQGPEVDATRALLTSLL